MPGGDVTIVFNPNGAVDSVYIGGASHTPSPIRSSYWSASGNGWPQSTHLRPNNPDTCANWRDLNNLWVVINPQTGLITSGEVAAVPAWNAATLRARRRRLQSSTPSDAGNRDSAAACDR